jgi:F-type H+-transporting ATPase subunit epsilon|tara:strand:- start:1026 stop:1268 length:243 start_codon:yes stop_codon:yes gene_type:complete
MIVEILTLEEILLSKEVKSVIVPGKSGDFEMLDNHAPIISILKKGTVKVTDINNDETSIELSGGSIEMSNNKITILAEKE